MNAFFVILLATVIGAANTWMLYKPEWKDNDATFWVAIGCALVNNYLWITLSKKTLDSTHLMQYGAYWDTALVIISIGIPMACFGARMTLMTGFGFLLMFAGMAIVKLTS